MALVFNATVKIKTYIFIQERFLKIVHTIYNNNNYEIIYIIQTIIVII